MTTIRFLLVVAVVACTIATVPLVPVVSTAGPALAEPPGENDTLSHENPDAVSDDADPEAVEAWLVDRLVDRLEESTNALGDGDLERANGRLSDAEARLEQLRTVSSRTGNEAFAGTFDEIVGDHRLLLEQVEAYSEDGKAADAAYEDDNVERAEERVRSMEALAASIDEKTEALATAYVTVQEEVETDTAEVQTALSDLSETALDVAGEFRSVVFEPTELTVDADENISVTEPLSAEGTLTTTDGEPIDADEIELEVADDTVETVVDNGTFEFDYRPEMLPLAIESLALAYVPETESPYAGSQTTVPVSIEQAEPTLSIERSPEAVAYRETVTIDGELVANGEPIDDVPLETAIDGTELAHNRSDDGEVTIEAELPADVPVGQRELSVSIPLEEHAIAGTESTESVAVEQTETTLVVEADHVVDRDVRVTGQFLTEDGTSVSAQPLEIAVGDVPAGTTTTETDGGFNETVTAPADAGEGTVNVTVSDDEETSNLRSKPATTSVSVPRDPLIDLGPAATWIELGIVAVVVLVATTWLFHRRDRQRGVDDDFRWE